MEALALLVAVAPAAQVIHHQLPLHKVIMVVAQIHQVVEALVEVVEVVAAPPAQAVTEIKINLEVRVVLVKQQIF